MPGLSAKVFRTYNASVTLQKELEDLPVDTPTATKVRGRTRHAAAPRLPYSPAYAPPTSPAQMLEYNRANREVAILCNHQKTVSKSYEASYAKLEERERLLERQIAELRAMLTDLAGKGGGAGIRLKAAHAGDDDEDEDEEAGAGKAAAKVEASAGAGGPATDAAAAKKAAEKAAAAADSHLFAKTPDAAAVKKRIKVRGGRGSVRVRAAADAAVPASAATAAGVGGQARGAPGQHA